MRQKTVFAIFAGQALAISTPAAAQTVPVQPSAAPDDRAGEQPEGEDGDAVAGYTGSADGSNPIGDQNSALRPAAPDVHPLGRVENRLNTRIESRIQSRIDTRIDEDSTKGGLPALVWRSRRPRGS